MGFALTILYIAVAYLSPAAVVPGLVEYRIQLWLAILALLASVPSLPGSRLLRTPQTYLLAGLTVAVFASHVANHWTGGGVAALQQFLPHAIAFLLVYINCRTLRQLKILVFVLVAIAITVVAFGASAVLIGDWKSLFLYFQQTEKGAQISRICGLNFLNDPNDLAQFLVTAIALLWVFVRKVKTLTLAAIAIPTAFLVYGIYLTHSRGGALALVVVVLFAMKKRLGPTRSVALALVALSLIVALNFSGGRAASDSSTTERMAAWGTGLQLFKSSPVFGVGFNRFIDSSDITAHNSFVLCVAELGLFGYFFWMGLIVAAFSQLNSVLAISPNNVSADLKLPPPDDNPDELYQPESVLPYPKEISAADIQRWAQSIRLALVGFLAAAWFLSRAYIMTLYILIGMAAVVVRLMTRQSQESAKPWTRLVMLTATWNVLSVVILYVGLRLRSLF